MSLVYVAPDAKLGFIILSQLLLGKVFQGGGGGGGVGGGTITLLREGDSLKP